MEASIPFEPPVEPPTAVKRSLEVDELVEESGSPPKLAKVEPTLDGPTPSSPPGTTPANELAERETAKMVKLVGELEDELWCGLCAAVLYKVGRPPSQIAPVRPDAASVDELASGPGS